MSHIADLMKPEKLQAANAPLGSLKALKNRSFLGLAGLVLLGGLGLAAWHAAASTPPANAAPQAVPVTVAAVDARPVRIWSEFSGRMTAVDSADVRPEAGSIAESIPPIPSCLAADGRSHGNIRTGKILDDGRTNLDPRVTER